MENRSAPRQRNILDSIPTSIEEVNNYLLMCAIWNWGISSFAIGEQVDRRDPIRLEEVGIYLFNKNLLSSEEGDTIDNFPAIRKT